MVTVKKEGIILQKTNNEFENEGVLNPAVIREGNNVHLYYRAVRTGNYSTIGYCRLNGPLKVAERYDKPLLSPAFDYESHGMEDPRIVKIDDLYYLTYTAYDGVHAQGALATSKSLLNFEKQGLITSQFTYTEFNHLAKSSGKVNKRYFHNPSFYHMPGKPDKATLLWEKDVMFFPRRINGKLIFLHRIRPGIQAVAVNDLNELNGKFWENYFLHLNDHIVLDPLYVHEAAYIGGGCPPVETEEGWLLIYHSVELTAGGLVYVACASLLDLDNPLKEISRLPYALFYPENDWEKTGIVNNVVFPTGTALFEDTLYIYYGAADQYIACASVELPELLSELLNSTASYERSNTAQSTRR